MRRKQALIYGSVLLLCGIGSWERIAAREAASPQTGKEKTVAGKDPSPARWIVLPDDVRPHLAPSFQAPRDEQALRHPEAIEEVRRVSSKKPEHKEGEWIEFRRAGKALYLPTALLTPHAPPSAKHRNLPIGRETVNMKTSLPLDYSPDDLTFLSKKWNYAKEGKVRLRREVAQMVEKMFAAAKREKIHLRAVSGYRSAQTQRKLYLKKIEETGLDQNVVAKPGYSEHQLGTALDVSGLDPKTVLTAAFGDTAEGRWLRENAAKYGFRISYTAENSKKTGYVPEPWHVRYVGVKE